ncbi:MAG: hypothetical protein IT327_06395 [Anaerolineae bacterium]|nr:hypothetical protein [Anaerolineae bacterium]
MIEANARRFGPALGHRLILLDGVGVRETAVFLAAKSWALPTHPAAMSPDTSR